MLEAGDYQGNLPATSSLPFSTNGTSGHVSYKAFLLSTLKRSAMVDRRVFGRKGPILYGPSLNRVVPVTVAAFSPLSENVENYLEHILRICKKSGHAKTGEIAAALKVAASSVTEMLAKLERDGFIKHTPYKGVELTEAGYFRALEVLKKHNLAARFLEEIVGMDHEAAHEWGCRMEHVIPPDLEKWFYRELQIREKKA